MTGLELATLCGELNGGASIGDTPLAQFLNLAKSIIEQKRPWVILRVIDSTKRAYMSLYTAIQSRKIEAKTFGEC